MALNIKNIEVERLAAQIAEITGETKTEAIRRALLERKDRLGLPAIEVTIAEIEEGLNAILGDRRFEPVSKKEWDDLFE